MCHIRFLQYKCQVMTLTRVIKVLSHLYQMIKVFEKTQKFGSFGGAKNQVLQTPSFCNDFCCITIFLN